MFNQQNDTTYIVNFWATWCKPCVEELPHFQELNEKYAGQPLRIVLVSLDFKKDVHTKLLSFIEERQLELPVVALTDGNQAGWIDRVDNSWGGAIPVTVIYKNGLRHFVNEQFDTYYDLEALVKPLI
ncbi:MAG: TlpA disulfide reductase family protein [Bacteroidota bacterium]